jgi:hypothetical protein
MNVLFKYIFVVFSILAPAGIAAADEIQVFAQVDSSKDIYIGENFAYSIVISGANKPGDVDLSPLAKFNPQSAGNRDVSQTSISIINGRTTQNVVKQYVMSYMLSCNSEGLAEIPSVTVTIGGKSYQTDPVQVNILRPGNTDRLDLDVTLSQEKCYVGQPVVMTVKFYISADIGDFQFNIPAFNDDVFYIEDPDIIDPQAKLYRLSESGITILASQNRVVHNGKDSVLLSFSKVLIPKNSGDIVLAASSVSANVAVGRARTRDRFFNDFFGQKEYKRFMVSSQPLNLSVLPLPAAGKPSQFYGLVGKYSISASASPTSVNVGDPITLTIKIGGSKFLKPVQWPDLEQLPEFADNFKMPAQKAAPTIEDGFKVFTQTIRANNDKVTQIPPIPLCYFDADKGEYVTAQSEPIKLEVAPTKILTGADIEGADFTPVNKEVEAIKKGLSANYEGPDVLTNMEFSPLAAITSPGYILLLGLPFACLVLSSVVKVFTTETPERTAQRRRRRASGKAVRQLKKIQSVDSRQRYELLASIMKQYIGERFDRQAGSLTAEDCRMILADVTGDTRTADKYRDIIDRCEAVRYASAQADTDSVKINELMDLIRIIEKKSRK